MMNDGNFLNGGVGRAMASDSSAFVREGERIDDLQLDGLKIIQRPDAFRFGTDSVLLADFAHPKPRDRVADLGAGTLALCLLMAGHEKQALFDAIEIQPEIADMAARSVRLNHLEARIRVYQMDMREAAARLGYGRHTLVVCNPPYSPAGTALTSACEAERIARHAQDITINDVARAAAQLLKNGGRAAFVYPAPRLFDLMCALRDNRLEPKRIQIVQDRPGSVPKLALLDAVKGAKSMLSWMEPLILRDADGGWSAQWRRIYRVDA